VEMSLLSRARDESSELSDAGDQQPPSTSQIVGDTCQNDDEAGESPATAVPSSPIDSSASQQEITATVDEQSLDRSKATANSKRASADHLSEQEPRPNAGIFSDWTFVKSTLWWDPGNIFCVEIKCSTQLNEAFEISFGEYPKREPARVALRFVDGDPGSRQRYLYYMSCKIPNFLPRRLFYGTCPVRVYPRLKSSGVSEPFFDVGMLRRTH